MAVVVVISVACDGGDGTGSDSGDAAPDRADGGDVFLDVGGESGGDALDAGDVDASVDGGEPWPLPEGEAAFRVAELTFTDARLCDLDGDGVEDNAFADLGGAAGEGAAALLGQFLAGALESPSGMGLLFPAEPEGAPEGRRLVLFLGEGASFGEELRAPSASLDECGEPLFVFSTVAVDGAGVSASGGALPLPLGREPLGGEARLFGNATVGEAGPELLVDACVSFTLKELGEALAPTEAGDRTALDVMAAGGAAFGRPGIVGLAPNLDLDGDGLERLNVDGDGRLTGCVDGDRTPIEGAGCWRDPRMADGFGFVVRLSTVLASFGGRGSGWLGCCAEGLPAESLLGEPWSLDSTGEQVAANGFKTCYVALDGTLRCWGGNPNGELGYGHTADVGDDESPASAGVVDVGGPVVSVDFGPSHMCAVLAGGSVRCWGASTGGELGFVPAEAIGDDETPASAPFVDVGEPALRVDSGLASTCALLEGGRVRCWGASPQGQLGYGNTETIGDDETPAAAGDVDVGGPVEEIAVGVNGACALLEGGTVRCWGDGSSGQLGYGNTDSVGDDETPASVGLVDVGGAVAQLSRGSAHACAVLEGGTVRCWGDGSSGQLGYGNTATIGDDETPASAGDVDLGGRAVQVIAATSHTCAILEGGAVRCWGSAANGQLGYGNAETIGDDETPASAGDVDLGGPAVSLDVGASHTCAILADRSVRCWGAASWGQLGYGNEDVIGDDETPSAVGPVELGICPP